MNYLVYENIKNYIKTQNMNKLILFFTLISCATLFSCHNKKQTNQTTNLMEFNKGTFGYDLHFLKKHESGLVVLGNENSKVILSPKYQGRVMTSTATGDSGISYGWINHELIASGKLTPHMNAFGGEERFWIGPEGGQYSVYFKKGAKFDIANWQTPAFIDTEPYQLIENQANKAIFTKDFEVENYSGTKFKVSLNREISLLNETQAEKQLKLSLKDVKWVGYQTVNDIKNTGDSDWDKSKGVLSIWLLGMMNASAKNTIIIPFQSGKANQINDAYFGKISADRLIKKDSVLFFKADADSRGKIGIPPIAVKNIAGSYDAEHKVFTILQFDYNGEKDFVNSMWEIQKHPYKGDVLNAYNDGKNSEGTQMGAFYELESSSPAVELKRNQTLRHTQRTFHFEGTKSQMDAICQQLLGVSLSDLPQF